MKKRFKAIIAIMMVLVMSVAFFACSKKEEEPTETTTESTTVYIPPTNPFTGNEISESADGKRPVAIVVENHSDARPQFGIGSADITCEGEVEGGISRMLWVYADSSAIPDEIGPLRSARPSFVEFSQFFDAVFVHWGGSHSKGNYVGGYETISANGVDDIDGMNGGALFGRNKTRRVSSEHTGVMYAKELDGVMDSKGYRKEINKDNIVALDFNENATPAGETPASGVNVKFSSRTDTRKFTFSSEDSKYHTNDWDTDVSFENLILLKADSTYITAPYKNSSTTYLNYSWTSGSGTKVSDGKACDITWSVTDGKLSIKDSMGSAISLNKGQSYIGFVSANHEGSVDCLSE